MTDQNNCSDKLQQLQADAKLPHTPTPLTYDVRMAISGVGPRAGDWFDKPHRLIYDLCREIEARATQPAAPAGGEGDDVDATLDEMREVGVVEAFEEADYAILYRSIEESGTTTAQEFYNVPAVHCAEIAYRLRATPSPIAQSSAGIEDADQSFAEMLWKWFEDRGCDLRTERREGLSADEFRIMLDEHEAALMPDVAQPKREPKAYYIEHKTLGNDLVPHPLSVDDIKLGWRATPLYADSASQLPALSANQLRDQLQEMVDMTAPTLKSEQRLSQGLSSALIRSRQLLAALAISSTPRATPDDDNAINHSLHRFGE